MTPEQHAQMDADLDDWGRWSQRRRGGWKSACGSAEGQYRAPWRQWHYPTAEEMMPKPAQRDMLALDHAIVRLPIRYLEIIRCHYFWRLAPRKSRVRLAIHVSAWDEELSRARQMVHNNMQADKRSREVLTA